MKKLSIFLACAAMIGLASCETEKEPVLTIPEGHSFVLNQPVFADEYLQLTEGGTFELVASQPDYGYAAAAVYSAEVSLTPEFTEFEKLKPIDSGLARMTFNDADLAKALCTLHGFDPGYYEDLPAEKIYFRAHCEIPGVEGTLCTSNVVSMNKVKFYFAVEGQRSIYLVGSPSGWAEPSEASASTYASWTLTETGIGTNIYLGSFTLPAGENTLRFYTALTGWDGASIGSQVEDNPIEIEIKDNLFEGPCVNGKGSWKFTLAEEINVNFTVDLDKMTVKFEVGGEVNWDMYPCIYLVGNPNGWPEPGPDNADTLNKWRLYDTTGAGIYVCKEPMLFPAGDNYFRFYSELTGWGSDNELPSMGPVGTDGQNVAVEFTDGVFAGTWVPGKGSWVISADGNTYYNLELNMNDGTVKFSVAE